jgi:vacuolar protein sorting-associated protein 3
VSITFFNLLFPVVSAYDDPYLVALMPDQSLEIRDIETQSVKQVVPAPQPSPERPNEPRRGLAWNTQSHMVPSTQLKDVLQLVPVPLIR